MKEVEIGKPGPGQARVRIAIAGVNFVDIYQRRGTYSRELPYVPGLEGAPGLWEDRGENSPLSDDERFHQARAFLLELMVAIILVIELSFRHDRPLHTAAGGPYP